MFGRRAFLAGSMAAVTFSGSDVLPAVAAQKRVAVIDWAHLETCLALGITPVAGSELRQYRKIVRVPEMPDTVADLGLRGSPNLEMLRFVEPDITVISQFYEYQTATLATVAPVLSLPSYEAGTPPYGLLENSAVALGEALAGNRALHTLWMAQCGVKNDGARALPMRSRCDRASERCYRVCDAPVRARAM